MMVTAILQNVTDSSVPMVVQGESVEQVVRLAMESLDVTFRKIGPMRRAATLPLSAMASWVDPNGQVWELVRVMLVRSVDHL